MEIFPGLREQYEYVYYRVENRILPVEVFVYFYSMVQDINLKIGIDDPQALLYHTIKVQNIDSTSVSVITIIMVMSIIL